MPDTKHRLLTLIDVEPAAQVIAQALWMTPTHFVHAPHQSETSPIAGTGITVYALRKPIH